jgi:hypothetical protein
VEVGMIKLKPISIAFITAQVLDAVTTAIVIPLGFTEMNYIVNHFGWLPLAILKVLVTVGATIFFEKIEIKKYFWLLVLLAISAPIWNIYQFILFCLER